MVGYQVRFNKTLNKFEADDIPVIFKDGMRDVYDTYKHACFGAKILNEKLMPHFVTVPKKR